MKLLIAVVALLAITVLGVGGNNIALIFSDLVNDLRTPSVAVAYADESEPVLGDTAAPAGVPSGDHIPGHIELLKEDGESARKVLEEVFSEQLADGSFRLKLEPTARNEVVRLTGSAVSWDNPVFRQFDQLVCALFVPTTSDVSSSLPTRRSSVLRRYHLTDGDLKQVLMNVTELLQEEIDARKMAVVANFPKKTIYVAGSPGALVRVGEFVERATGEPATSEQVFGTAHSLVHNEASKQPEGHSEEETEPSIPSIRDETPTGNPHPTDPRELAQDYREIERRAARLAAELQQNRNDEGGETPQGNEARSALKGAVEAAFEARERWQLAELALLRSRLERLEQGVKRRAQARGEIIERRVQELLEADVFSDKEFSPADATPRNPLGTKVRPGSFPSSSRGSLRVARPVLSNSAATSIRDALMQKLTAAEVELELERAKVTAQREEFEQQIKRHAAGTQKLAEAQLEDDPRVIQLRQQMRELETNIRVRPADSVPVKSSKRKLEELEAKLVELKAEILPGIQDDTSERMVSHYRDASAKAEDSLRQRERVVELLRKKVEELRRSSGAESARQDVRELLRKKLIDTDVDIEFQKAALTLLKEKSSASSDDLLAIQRAEERLRNSESAAALIREKLDSTDQPASDTQSRQSNYRRSAAIWMTNKEEAYERASEMKRPLLKFIDRPVESLDSALERDVGRAWMHSTEILDLLETSFVAVQYTDDGSGLVPNGEPLRLPKVVIVAPRGTTIAQFAPFQYDDRFLKLLRKIAAEYDTRAAADAPSPANPPAGKATERQELARTFPAKETTRSPLIETSSDPREKLIDADEAAKQAETRYRRAEAGVAMAERTLDQIRLKAQEDPSKQADLLRAEEGNRSALVELEAAHSAVARSRRQLDFARENLAARVRLLELDLAEAELRLENAKSAEESARRLFEDKITSQSKYSEKLLPLKRAELDYERAKIQLDLYRKTLAENGGDQPAPAEAAKPAAPPVTTVPDPRKPEESKKTDDPPASQKPALSAEEGRNDRAGAGKTPTPYRYDTVRYAWLRGIVERDASDVRLRYSEESAKDDLYGGSMRLVGHPDIEPLKAGEVVQVRGWVDPREKDGTQKPSYRVEELLILKPKYLVTHPVEFPVPPSSVVLRAAPDDNLFAELPQAEATYEHRVKWAARMHSLWHEARANLDKGRRAARTDPSKATLLPKLEKEFRLAHLQKDRASHELAKWEERLNMLRRRLENRAEWSKGGNSSTKGTGPRLVDPTLNPHDRLIEADEHLKQAPLPFKYDRQAYTWLRGIVSPEPQGAGWRLQYTADPSEDEKYGGSLRLVGHSHIENLIKGAVALAKGAIDPTEKDANGKPSYRVETLQYLLPRVHGPAGETLR